MLEAFISDVHFPFEDKRAWELALKVIHYAKPGLVFIGGDFIDCYAVSSFSRDPRRVVNFQLEIDSAVDGLREVRQAATKAEIKFLYGNHEERLQKWTNEHPEVSSLKALTIPELLKMRAFDVKVVEAYVKIGKLWHIHGHEAGGGSVYPAKNVYQKMLGSLLMGHYHKAQEYYNNLLDNTTHGSFCNPCLCQRKQEYIKGISQWQQGLTFIEYTPSWDYHREVVVFYSDGKSKKLCAMWRGKLFSC